MSENIWFVIALTFILTLATYLLGDSESFTSNCILEASPYGQERYFGPHIPGPAWAFSPRDRGWD